MSKRWLVAWVCLSLGMVSGALGEDSGTASTAVHWIAELFQKRDYLDISKVMILPKRSQGCEFAFDGIRKVPQVVHFLQRLDGQTNVTMDKAEWVLTSLIDLIKWDRLVFGEGDAGKNNQTVLGTYLTLLSRLLKTSAQFVSLEDGNYRIDETLKISGMRSDKIRVRTLVSRSIEENPFPLLTQVSADGNKILRWEEVEGGDAFVLRQTSDWKELTRVRLPQGIRPAESKLSWDGERLVVSGHNSWIGIYDLSQGTHGPLVAETRLSVGMRIESIAVSPSFDRVALNTTQLGLPPSILYIWDVERSRPRQIAKELPPVTAMVFLPYNKSLLVASGGIGQGLIFKPESRNPDTVEFWPEDLRAELRHDHLITALSVDQAGRVMAMTHQRQGLRVLHSQFIVMPENTLDMGVVLEQQKPHIVMKEVPGDMTLRGYLSPDGRYRLTQDFQAARDGAQISRTRIVSAPQSLLPGFLGATSGPSSQELRLEEELDPGNLEDGRPLRFSEPAPAGNKASTSALVRQDGRPDMIRVVTFDREKLE